MYFSFFSCSFSISKCILLCRCSMLSSFFFSSTNNLCISLKASWSCISNFAISTSHFLLFSIYCYSFLSYLSFSWMNMLSCPLIKTFFYFSNLYFYLNLFFTFSSKFTYTFKFPTNSTKSSLSFFSLALVLLHSSLVRDT